MGLPKRAREILEALGNDELPGREIAKRCKPPMLYGTLYAGLRDLRERGLVVVVRSGEDEIGLYDVFAATRDGKREMAYGDEAAGVQLGFA